MWVALCLFTAVLTLAWRYLTAPFNYWQNKGVRSLANPKPLFGSLWPLLSLQVHLAQFYKRAYEEFDDEAFVGYYQGLTPGLLIRDPELIKKIIVKDFSHFVDHGFKIHEENDPLEARNLFNLEGQKWREMRIKLTPTFTSGRMKAMFPLMLLSAEELEKYLLAYTTTGEEFEAKELMSRYTTDVIGSCAFGINCNSMLDPDNEFRTMGKKLTTTDFWSALTIFLAMFFPTLSGILRLSVINKELTNFFRKMVHDVIEMRLKTGQTRNDFMQLMIELKEKGQLTPEDGENNELSNENLSTLTKLTDDDVVAQATVFFFAGFETSSTTTSFALLELAANPDLQRRLHQELDEVLQQYDGQLTYQAVQKMKYLDCVVLETMRKYPPGLNLMRVCTKNYLIPGTDVTIEQGTPIVIPTYAMHNDPKYFPDPECFDPDRFSNDETSQKNKFIYLPFGEGPRQCIGNRFALMQSKLGMIAVMRKYEVELSSRTKYPTVIDAKQLFLANVGGSWLKVKLRFEE